MNKTLDIEEWSDYFAEVAASNPQQLPQALAAIMQYRLMLALTDAFILALGDFETRLDERLNELFK